MTSHAAVMGGASAALLVTSLLLNVIAFSTNHWADSSQAGTVLEFGLWTTCLSNKTRDDAASNAGNGDDVVTGAPRRRPNEAAVIKNCFPTDFVVADPWSSNWVNAVRTIFTLTLVAVSISCVNMLLFVSLPATRRFNPGLAFASICAAIAAVMLGAVGDIIVAVQQRTDGLLERQSTLSWSFALHVASLPLALASTVVLLVEFYFLVATGRLKGRRDYTAAPTAALEPSCSGRLRSVARVDTTDTAHD